MVEECGGFADKEEEEREERVEGRRREERERVIEGAEGWLVGPPTALAWIDFDSLDPISNQL